jgi:SAM-dependent methyltransferase
MTPGGEELHRPPELARMFDRAAGAYDARPGYPDRVYELLEQRCGLGPGCRVVEIGPGTGQATGPMLDRGARITAVEPGAALADRLAERMAGRDLTIVRADLETAELADGAFDLLAAATSFHWIDPSIGLDRAAGCLTDHGAIAVWWTIWGDPERPDPLHEHLVPILREKAPALAADDAENLAHVRDIEHRGERLATHPAFDDFAHETIRWEGRHGPDELRAIFATFGGWIALPEPLRTELLDDVAGLVRDDFEGEAVRPYRTEVFTARRRHHATVGASTTETVV